MPRKKPFSGKQKKKQLQDKRSRKQGGPRYLADLDKDYNEEEDKSEYSGQPELDKKEQTHEDALVHRTRDVDSFLLSDFNIQKIHEQPEKNPKAESLSINNFRLHFFKESDDVIEKRKRDHARKPLRLVDEKHIEMRLMDIYPSDVLLDFPKRPSWNYSMSKEKVDAQEQKYFKDYISQIIRQDRYQELSYFELNLETWRQLWRVLEISDVLLIITDARCPVLHVPPSLIRYITQDLHKFVIIILNKIDFLPPVLVSVWKSYLESQFPGTTVVLFSSQLKEMHDDANIFRLDFTQGLNKKPSRGPSLVYGPSLLFEVCKDIVKDKVDLSSWRKKLEEDGLLMDTGGSGTSIEDNGISVLDDRAAAKDLSGEFKDNEDLCWQMSQELSLNQSQPLKPLFSKDILTLGCIGFPNVGKSSLINALVGRKVVSVSQTPGRTKHFQTIFLSPTVKLCDCPGLVFPSIIPKSLQVIAGIFPVAHVREPYSVVGYLGKRVNLPHALKLHPPDNSPKKRDKKSGEYIWSAYSICEAWALRNGFMTSKAGRPDLFRAANKILRMAVDGQICLYFKPPDCIRHLEQAKADLIVHNLHDFLVSSRHRRETTEKVIEESDDEVESDDNEDDDDVDNMAAVQDSDLAHEHDKLKLNDFNVCGDDDDDFEDSEET